MNSKKPRFGFFNFFRPAPRFNRSQNYFDSFGLNTALTDFSGVNVNFKIRRAGLSFGETCADDD